MEVVMILGAGEVQVPIIKEANAKGLQTIVVDYDTNAPGMLHADIPLEISTTDFDAVLNAAQKYKIDGILTTSDYPVNVVAYVCQKMGLYSMNPDVAKICTNKYLQRQFFMDNHILAPVYWKINSRDELEGINKFPVVIKPVDSSASRGVKKVNSVRELKEQYECSKEFSRCGQVIVEEFINGQEYSVETLSQGGIHHIVAITEKHLIDESSDCFVENRHIVPANIDCKLNDRINEIVLDLLKKLSVDNCPCHVELKINQDGIYIIEIGCRLGGDFITSDLVPLALGINMMECLIDIALGKLITLRYNKQSVAAIQFVNHSNYFKCIDFAEKNSTQYVSKKIDTRHARKIESSFDRMGYLILQADNHESMNKLLSQIN